jgi:hypothetical protein
MRFGVFLFLVLAIMAESEENNNFRNRLKFENGTHITYQRRLFSQVYLGPSIGYDGVFEVEDGLLHVDQQPSVALVNLSCDLAWKNLGLENIAIWLYDAGSASDYIIESKIKYLIKASNWAIVSPNISWIRFEWYPREKYANSMKTSKFRFKSLLALNVELEIRF